MSTPRIIAGSAKGARLRDVPGSITRPITDRVKEALFSILGNNIIDADFLDLFGGTGSVGIEALSRGARFVRFIDLHRAAVATIKTNLKHTRLAERAEALRADALATLGKPPDRPFDYIYIAPPQYKDIWLKTLQCLDQNPGWLAEDGWVVVQIDPVEYRPVEFQVFKEFDQRRYGSTLLVFYKKEVS